jgi:virulence-associated protein VagC
METATVILEGDSQTVRLPKGVHLPAKVFVRQEGETVVFEPAKPKTWPEGFFDSIHVTAPAFERPEQGQLRDSSRQPRRNRNYSDTGADSQLFTP